MLEELDSIEYSYQIINKNKKPKIGSDILVALPTQEGPIIISALVDTGIYQTLLSYDIYNKVANKNKSKKETSTTEWTTQTGKCVTNEELKLKGENWYSSLTVYK